ncbi:unnamed protein product [Schistocephalus solidus]|uniref:Uncharacterized protein n=1 Tax=Schistocephalus solidus TaxID=70667 RepID=A0A183T3W0_SCHSO|nr:unnamed protein product [Schistocephalus solidus]
MSECGTDHLNRFSYDSLDRRADLPTPDYQTVRTSTDDSAVPFSTAFCFSSSSSSFLLPLLLLISSPLLRLRFIQQRRKVDRFAHLELDVDVEMVPIPDIVLHVCEDLASIGDAESGFIIDFGLCFVQQRWKDDSFAHLELDVDVEMVPIPDIVLHVCEDLASIGDAESGFIIDFGASGVVATQLVVVAAVLLWAARYDLEHRAVGWSGKMGQDLVTVWIVQP